MDKILSFISDKGEAVIILSWLVVLAAMVCNYININTMKTDITELLTRRNKQYEINKETHNLDETIDEDAAVTPDTIRQKETDFNKKCAQHNVFTQLISVFPLLGILGTVAGLILQVKAADVNSMLSSLDTALSTTFWGLIAAIALKFFDAVWPSKVINDVEVMLDDYYKRISLAEIFEQARKSK